MRSDHRPDPPVGRWLPLSPDGDSEGYLAVYLREPLARYPIRHVTRPADNKSDPNIETGTFGLFSTCERMMRGKIVREQRSHIFFLTTPKPGRGRKLTGYYRLGWYTPSVGGAGTGDFALAASRLRFIDPVSLDELPDELKRVCAPQFRTIRPIDATTTAALQDLVDARPDRTERYLKELRRIERFAHRFSGYSYPSWGQGEPFTWDLAEGYLGDEQASDVQPRKSHDGRWRCSACDYVIESKALLKACPICKEKNTLNPEM